MTSVRVSAAIVCAGLYVGVPAAAQQAASAAVSAPNPVTASVPAATPPGYVIGADDVLAVFVYGFKEHSVDNVTVRPDGKISLPLVNDIQAAGFTPEELRKRIADAETKFIKGDPDVSVMVKEVHSRNVYISGMVAKSNTYPLATKMTVLQLIAQAGGVLEYANSEEVVILRNEGGKQVTLKFNYKEVTKGKRPEQNIELMPGDTVIVP